jgi:FkbM family methyltransferase
MVEGNRPARAATGNESPLTLVATPWWQDRAIVGQFPVLYRLHAYYIRLVRALGLTRGEGFVFRLAGRIHQGVLHRPPSSRVEIGGVVVYLDFTDARMRWVLDELRLETPEKSVLRSLLGPGDTFIDAGANHGSFSLIAAQLVAEHGFVAAFEPQPRLSRLVRESLAATKKRNFRVYELACSDREGEVDLYVPWLLSSGSGSAGIHKALSAPPGHSTVRVRTATLDMELPGSVVLKVDVEGSELATLRGARGIIDRYRPAIVIEINARSAAAAGTTPDQMLDLLQELGYSTFAELEEYPSTRPRPMIGDLARLRNVLALRPPD